ncbi:hypothetical protein DFH07DRAFT_940728 [Mycena maculata]|uniref:Uncharacterized protein n=1 Tax=Mycena maculata TaxID=230809 RepID=A0AAD7J6E5_9AGAR|nr:hypothetical protein DFH07DRAFT_940728 [Mycena maculata]
MSDTQGQFEVQIPSCPQFPEELNLDEDGCQIGCNENRKANKTQGGARDRTTCAPKTRPHDTGHGDSWSIRLARIGANVGHTLAWEERKAQAAAHSGESGGIYEQTRAEDDSNLRRLILYSCNTRHCDPPDYPRTSEGSPSTSTSRIFGKSGEVLFGSCGVFHGTYTGVMREWSKCPDVGNAGGPEQKSNSELNRELDQQCVKAVSRSTRHRCCGTTTVSRIQLGGILLQQISGLKSLSPVTGLWAVRLVTKFSIETFCICRRCLPVIRFRGKVVQVENEPGASEGGQQDQRRVNDHGVGTLDAGMRLGSSTKCLKFEFLHLPSRNFFLATFLPSPTQSARLQIAPAPATGFSASKSPKRHHEKLSK